MKFVNVFSLIHKIAIQAAARNSCPESWLVENQKAWAAPTNC